MLLSCITQHFRISKINPHDTHALADKRVQDQGGTSQIVDHVPLTLLRVFHLLKLANLPLYMLPLTVPTNLKRLSINSFKKRFKNHLLKCHSPEFPIKFHFVVRSIIVF